MKFTIDLAIIFMAKTNELLISSIMKILEERKWTLATAESCTGGMVASRIVELTPEHQKHL